MSKNVPKPRRTNPQRRAVALYNKLSAELSTPLAPQLKDEACSTLLQWVRRNLVSPDFANAVAEHRDKLVQKPIQELFPLGQPFTERRLSLAGWSAGRHLINANVLVWPRLVGGYYRLFSGESVIVLRGETTLFCVEFAADPLPPDIRKWPTPYRDAFLQLHLLREGTFGVKADTDITVLRRINMSPGRAQRRRIAEQQLVIPDIELAYNQD